MRSDVEVDFSPSDEALAKRLALAAKYVSDISKDGVWCSAPSIVAFSIARLDKFPVRVYFCSGSSLYVFADTVPEGALRPPPPHLDEFLLDFVDAADLGHPVGDDDDLHAFVPPEPSPSDPSKSAVAAAGGGSPLVSPSAGSGSPVDEDDEPFTQNVTRVLFNGGHYDLGVTASERAVLVRVFPELARHFVRFPASLKPTFPE